MAHRSASILAAVSFLAGIAALALAGSAVARDDVPPEIAARENPVFLMPDRIRYYQRQFKGKCARCHGIDGTGKGPEAGDQLVAPRDLTDRAYMSTRSDGQIFYQILMGGDANSPMPAFGPESDQGWSEEKVWYMVAFVRRFSEPENE
jgi:mono/diheme cytochrome c family protein